MSIVKYWLLLTKPVKYVISPIFRTDLPLLKSRVFIGGFVMGACYELFLQKFCVKKGNGEIVSYYRFQAKNDPDTYQVNNWSFNPGLSRLHSGACLNFV